MLPLTGEGSAFGSQTMTSSFPFVVPGVAEFAASFKSVSKLCHLQRLQLATWPFFTYVHIPVSPISPLHFPFP